MGVVYRKISPPYSIKADLNRDPAAPRLPELIIALLHITRVIPVHVLNAALRGSSENTGSVCLLLTEARDDSAGHEVRHRKKIKNLDTFQEQPVQTWVGNHFATKQRLKKELPEQEKQIFTTSKKHFVEVED